MPPRKKRASAPAKKPKAAPRNEGATDIQWDGHTKLEEVADDVLLTIIEPLDIISATCLCITNKTLYRVFKMRKDRGKEVSQKKKGKGKGKKKEEGEEEEEEKEYIPVPLNLVLPQAPELPFNINLRLQLFGWIQERWPELISYDPTKGRYGMFVDQNAVIETSERLKARLERVTERAAAKKEKRDAAKAETKEHLRRQAEENGEEFDSEDSVSTVEGEESTSEESDGSVY